jgi:C-terminal processing protease CtpA/Prc
MNLFKYKWIKQISMMLFGGGLLIGSPLQSFDLAGLKEPMKQELVFIKNQFAQGYAPLLWKQQTFNLSLDEELRLAQNKVDECQTMRECRNAVVQFLASTRDYHVGYSFYSTEMSTLPLTIKSFEGKFIVVEVDDKKLDQKLIPIAVGDEVLEFNGNAIAEEAQKLFEHEVVNVEVTDRAYADLMLTRRRASRNYNVPKGTVDLKVKSNKEDKIYDVQLTWEYKPDSFARIDRPQKKSKLGFRLPQMLSMKALEMSNAASPYSLGTRESFLPAFGDKIWESEAENTFDAYIFKNEIGKLIGVVRIPSYTPDDEIKAVEQFGKIIERFQKVTDGMIIDQNNNPGGSVFYLYALASMLTDKALHTPKHKMAITYSEVQEAIDITKQLKDVTDNESAVKEMGSDLSGYPVSYQVVTMIRNFADFILAEWKAGKKLSSPYYIWGVDKINPNVKVQYTKPILVLTNELDFSGGDFFPAIMQDNKRVTVVGQRTAGAGGYVHSMEYPSAFGLTQIGYTGSIAERLSLNPIENLGVTPDILLPMTVEDVRNEFKPYRDAVMKVMNEKL